MIKNHYGITVNSEVPITGVIQNNHCEFLFEDALNGIDEVLIGFKWNEEAEQYDEDESEEYSAIVGGIYTQVTRSKWVIRCELCSPCYPGQGDIDTPGDFIAYCVPPDVIGDFGDQEVKKRIQELK